MSFRKWHLVTKVSGVISKWIVCNIFCWIYFYILFSCNLLEIKKYCRQFEIWTKEIEKSVLKLNSRISRTQHTSHGNKKYFADYTDFTSPKFSAKPNWLPVTNYDNSLRYHGKVFWKNLSHRLGNQYFLSGYRLPATLVTRKIRVALRLYYHY